MAAFVHGVVAGAHVEVVTGAAMGFRDEVEGFPDRVAGTCGVLLEGLAVCVVVAAAPVHDAEKEVGAWETVAGTRE